MYYLQEYSPLWQRVPVLALRLNTVNYRKKVIAEHFTCRAIWPSNESTRHSMDCGPVRLTTSSHILTSSMDLKERGLPRCWTIINYMFTCMHTHTHISILARPIPRGTVPFGASNMPFESAPESLMCPLVLVTT